MWAVGDVKDRGNAVRQRENGESEAKDADHAQAELALLCHFLVAPCARYEVVAPRSGIEGNHGEGEDECDGALDEGPDDPFRAEVEHFAEEIEDHADEETHEREQKPPPRVLVRCLALAGRIGGGRNTLRDLVGIG